MNINTLGLGTLAVAALLALPGPAFAASETGKTPAPYFMCYVDMHSEFSDDCGDLVVRPELTTGSISVRAEADQDRSYMCYVDGYYVSAADCGDFYVQPATTGSIKLPVSDNSPKLFMCYVGDQYVCADFLGNPATAGSMPQSIID